jgi:hypothetical protein
VLTSVRGLIVLLAALIVLAGFVALAVGEIGGGLWAIAVGAAGLLAVAFERARYRSELAEHGSEPPGPGGGDPERPGPPFRATDERFVDPTTGRLMRVYVDPATGERRYHAER